MSDDTIARVLYNSGASAPLDTPERGGVKRLAVDVSMAPGENDVVVGGPTTDDLSKRVQELLKNGSSSDMKVNGSSSPVEFSYAPGTSEVVDLYELRVVFSSQDILFDGDSFGALSALSNGVKIEVRSGGVTHQIGLATINEELLLLPSIGAVTLSNYGPKDILSFSVLFGGAVVLDNADSDFVKITIQDNLTAGGVNAISFFQAQVLGLLQ